MNMDTATLEQSTSSAPVRTASGRTLIGEAGEVHIPGWVADHASFRRWYHSCAFPEDKIRICYLGNEVWVDMSPEQLFTHNQVKGEFSRVLGNLMKEHKQGRFIPDGMMVSNAEAELSTVPDGVYVSFASLQADKVRLVEGAKAGYLELEGTPAIVLEVVSPSSVRKDAVRLRELYHRAGVPEYWLVDARGDEVRFDILRHAADGYKPTRRQKGWVKSQVLGKSFQLTREADALGHPEFTLRVR